MSRIFMDALTNNQGFKVNMCFCIEVMFMEIMKGTNPITVWNKEETPLTVCPYGDEPTPR